MESKTFLGTGWAFPPQFVRDDKHLQMVSAEQDIRQSLGILFSTSPGERVMQPDFGCGLKSMVFENISDATITQLQDLIERAVLFFEPRITLELVHVSVEDELEGIIEIELEYTIRGTNTRSNMVYPFYFLEGTSLWESR